VKTHKHIQNHLFIMQKKIDYIQSHSKIHEGPKINQSFEVVNGKKVSTASTEKHPAWLELLFDLVIVVAFEKLVHAFESDITSEKSTAPLLFAVKFLAVYGIWLNVDVYANRFGQMQSIWDFILFYCHFSSMAAMCVSIDVLAAPNSEEQHRLALSEFCLGVAFSSGILVVGYLRVALVLKMARPFAILSMILLTFQIIFYLLAALLPIGQNSMYVIMAAALLFDHTKDLFFPYFSRFISWGQDYVYIPINVALQKERLGLLVLIAIGEQIASIVGPNLTRRIYTGTMLACFQGFLFKWAYFDVFDVTGEVTETKHPLKRGRLHGIAHTKIHSLLVGCILVTSMYLRKNYHEDSAESDHGSTKIRALSSLSPFAETATSESSHEARSDIIYSQLVYSLSMGFTLTLVHAASLLHKRHPERELVENFHPFYRFGFTVACAIAMSIIGGVLEFDNSLRFRGIVLGLMYLAVLHEFAMSPHPD
jgi:low temperature requirement protein LtrA